MNLDEYKHDLNTELASLLNKIDRLLPRYEQLLTKPDLSDEELQEMGELEHFLLQLNATLTELNHRIEHDVFGHTLDTFYKAKEAAKEGNLQAKRKYNKLRQLFMESLDRGDLLNWN